jgi:hypothetical protein
MVRIEFDDWVLLQALAAAGKRAEYLAAQVGVLEQELQSRDSLLQEIKAETKRNTDALTVAAQIKQVAVLSWMACESNMEDVWGSCFGRSMFYRNYNYTLSLGVF